MIDNRRKKHTKKMISFHFISFHFISFFFQLFCADIDFPLFKNKIEIFFPYIKLK